VSQIEATFRHGNHVSCTVRLARRVDAAHRTDPTVARWWSFGWRVIEVRKVTL
jgi:transketolase N-terminal domain/subunit